MIFFERIFLSSSLTICFLVMSESEEPNLLDRVKRIEAMVCTVGKLVSKHDEQFQRMHGWGDGTPSRGD